MRYIKLIKKFLPYIIILLLSIFISIIIGRNKSIKNQLNISISNEKAFIAENSLLKENNRVFQFTIEQLSYFNDSILIKMDEVRKELKIKDKNLKQVQYSLSEIKKKDTISFIDTIFRDTTLNIDTLLKEEWYELNVNLSYPNSIIVTPKFISEKYVVISNKKETIKPPKKSKFLRMFQKKHKITEVEVVEKSPYIETKKQRFVEIIK